MFVFRKNLYVFDKNQPIPATIRTYEEKDFPGLIRVQQESFPPPFPSELWWNCEQLYNHVTLFPDAALCIEVEGEIAGSMTGLLIHEDDHQGEQSWDSATDRGYIRNHRPDGTTLYVVDISVRPTFRKLGIGKWLMQSMYEVVVQHRLERLLGGGRMPGYHRQASEMTPEQYVDKVVKGELTDPVLNFLLRCGRTPVKVVANYLDDEESCHYGTLMEWRNPFIQPIPSKESDKHGLY